MARIILISKVMLISLCVLSAAIMLTLTDFAPAIYNGVVSWLKPPFMYLVINCIIISIVASSKFLSPEEDDLSETMATFVKSYPAAEDGAVVIDPRVKVEEKSLDFNKENEYVMLKSTRFSPRRNVKVSPLGGRRVLGVLKAKKQQETLESTWKTITEGRPRHLRKSEDHKTMKKSKTFDDRSSSTDSNSSSLSQDELNRRVEAFINKFNQEMRLQRQQSLDHYRQIINHHIF
ncbi:hypothetical protein ACS0TY_018518 [Phlomoides rotata]